ncbi:MAG: MG2 domain-containing protein [Treponema sp.]
MKKISIILLAVGAVLSGGCGKSGQAGHSADVQQQAYIAELQERTRRIYDDPNISNFEKQFLPQYAIETPEPEQRTKIPAFKAPVPRSQSAADVSVIPGLRPLTAYKTAYTSERKASGSGSNAAVPATLQGGVAPAEQQEGRGAETIELAQQEPFTVADWGPKGKIPAAASAPAFYVVFSLPVKAIGVLDKPEAASPYLAISPAVKGIFRWYGSRCLAFEPQEGLIPGQDYTMTVQEECRALNGKKIQGKRQFTVRSEQLAITYFQPGYTLRKNSKRWIPINKNNLIPEAANEVLITFNYPVQPAELRSAFSVSVQEEGKPAVPYSCTLTRPEGKNDNSLLANIKGSIPFNAAVTLTVQRSDGSVTTASYHTLTPFTCNKAFVYHYDYGYIHPIRLDFSHNIDKKSIRNNISISPLLVIGEKNIEVIGSTVLLHDLPVTYQEEYTVTVRDGIKDTYGRTLASSGVYRVKIPDAPSFMHYADHGRLMLEAAYPHIFLLNYQNILAPSSYTAEETNNPLCVPLSKKYDTAAAKPLNTTVRNTRQFEAVDLNPYLKNGKGFVSIASNVTLPPYSQRDKKPRIEYSSSTIQVTDLGITVRSALNKTLVLVTKLSTGEPVEGASVYFYDAVSSYEGSAVSPEQGAQHPFASGTTDKDGLVILAHNIGSLDFFRKADYAAVFVEKEGDRAVFYPTSHNPWHFNVSSIAEPYEVAETRQRTYIFSDRGLYKPGEKVLFRGIDRTQQFGIFTPYSGKYTVTLSGYSSEGDIVVIDTIKDVCTDSGSFWGAFDIPENAAPGPYSIVYRREEKNSEPEECTITVAYFEKLKYQTEVDLLQTPLIMGDTITGMVSASYLSGGGLGGASYRGNWMRQGASFEPVHPSLKKYRFGTSGYGIHHVASFSGTLSDAGTAELSCKAADSEGIVGLPYRYVTEVSITDLSNQQISARNAVIVHPAAFYFGIAPPEKLTGFAEKGQELVFPFILASLDGNPLTDTRGAGGDFSVELIRENWKLVQERGSGGSIYSNYEKELITEYSEKLKPAVKGTIRLTPQNAGSYILSVSGTDTKSRKFKTDYHFYVTGSGAGFWDRDYEDSVRLIPDQPLYNPGDTARILMKSPLPKGRYLITVEREGIFTEEIREFDGSTQVLEIPVAANYVPVVYVAVSSYSVRTKEPVHKYGERDMDKPKGVFGMTPVFVNPRVKAFSVEIATDKSVYKPGEEAVVTLTAKRGGKPLAGAELTLLAVDRGVLDLIDYHVPNPLDFFYNPEHFPLGVIGGDSRSWLMAPIVQEVKTLAGGDSGGGKGDGANERSNFNPTAVFVPLLTTDVQGTVTAKFVLPDTLTSYRITAVGTKADLFALHEEEITVRNLVNVLPVMPRRLRERDTAECGVLISNTDSRDHCITVSASVRAPQPHRDSVDGTQATIGRSPKAAKDTQSGGGQTGAAFIDGETAHTVTVPAGRQAAVYFDIAAAQAGTVETVFSLSSGILNEQLIQPLTIERPFVFETVTASRIIGKDEQMYVEGVILPSGADRNTGSLAVTLDSSGLGSLSAAIDYVFEYPFLCMEQQSARILPLVLFEKYIDVFSLKSKVSDVHATVSKTFAAWAKEQHQDGGFPYWPGGGESDFYVSLRIAHICAAAQQRGYTERDVAIDTEKLAVYIWSELLANRKEFSPYLQAYACFVLSLNNIRIPNGILTDIKALVTPLAAHGISQPDDLAVIALLGLTYAQQDSAGGAAAAAECAETIISCCRFTTRSVTLAVPPPRYNRFWCSNDTSLDLALILQCLVKTAPDHSREDAVRAVLYTLLQRQRTGMWQNTAITAQVMEAIYDYICYAQLDSTDLTAQAAIEETELFSAAFKGAGAQPVSQRFSFKDELLSHIKRDTLVPLRFNKSGTGQLCYTASLSYALPQEQLDARDEGLGISYTIRDIAAGKTLAPDSETSPIITLESGKTYEMTVHLSSGKDYTFVALRAPIPSGAEILDDTFVTTASMQEDADDDGEPLTDWRSVSNYEIYDNEVQYFWNMWKKGSTTVQCKFRAARRGVFPCPPVTAGCMYENEIFGRSSGTLYVIK